MAPSADLAVQAARPGAGRQFGAARAEEVIERPAPVYATCRNC